jgi:hypothetical protein
LRAAATATGVKAVRFCSRPRRYRSKVGVTQRHYREDPAVIAAVHVQVLDTHGYDGLVIDDHHHAFRPALYD